MTAQMRILNCISDNRFGGPHRRNFAIAKRLQREGITTTFLFGHKEGRIVADDAAQHTYLKHMQFMRRRRPVLSLLAFFAFLPLNILKIHRLIRDNRIDIVHIDGITNVVPALAARLTRTPVVYHYNDHLPRLLQRFLVPMVGALSSKIIVQGESLRRSRTKGHAGLERKTIVIYGGIDTCQFDPTRYDAEAREQLRAQLGIPATCPLIGAIGNLNPLKGHAYFIEAARKVKTAMPDAKFIIVGRKLGTVPTYWEKLQRLTIELGLQDDVIFADFREDIPAILSILDVFVLSSVLESCPCVLLEAMAMKTPIVTTDVGAAAELVIDGQTGRVVPTRDDSAIAQAVLAYLSEPGPQTQTMVEAARKRVESEFEIGKIADQHKRVYEELMNRRPAAAPLENGSES